MEFSQAMNESIGSSIPGPYLTPEQTESYPLKKSLPMREHKTKGCCSCLQNDDSVGSLRAIISCFFVLTLAVTIALAVQTYYGDYQVVPHGSVATDSHECSTIGTDILKRGGSAVDAAIASTLCMGVVNPHVTGLGGGGFMTIYNHRKRKVLDVIDFREVAPSVINNLTNNPELFMIGGLSVGVPGLLRGLGLAHELYGKLPWKDLLKPVISLAKSGFPVPSSLISARSRLATNFKENTKLLKFFNALDPGQNITMPELARTLEAVSILGPDALYIGNLATELVSNVTQAGGQMSMSDLKKYRAKRTEASKLTFANFNIIVPGLPSGGPFLLEILKHLKNITVSKNFEAIVPVLAEAISQIYKSQLGTWGDPNFLEDNTSLQANFSSWNIPEAVGSHVAVIDSNDIYVSVVSGLNTWFGSQLMANGFILNNAMANFGIGNNSLWQGKRPLSLSTPVIAIQDKEVCGRRLVLGAGDAGIAVQLLTSLLLLEGNITSSMEAPRFRVTRQGAEIDYEGWRKPTFSNKTLSQLGLLNFQVRELLEPYQSCNLIEQFGDTLSSLSDPRGGGIASRY